jgi:hypothetical protein
LRGTQSFRPARADLGRQVIDIRPGLCFLLGLDSLGNRNEQCHHLSVIGESNICRSCLYFAKLSRSPALIDKRIQLGFADSRFVIEVYDMQAICLDPTLDLCFIGLHDGADLFLVFQVLFCGVRFSPGISEFLSLHFYLQRERRALFHVLQPGFDTAGHPT